VLHKADAHFGAEIIGDTAVEIADQPAKDASRGGK